MRHRVGREQVGEERAVVHQPLSQLLRRRLPLLGAHRERLPTGTDSARAEQEPGDEDAEEEAADVGEEGDPAAVGRRAEQPEVRLEQLAPRFGTRASAAVPSRSVIAVWVIIATNPPAT